MTLLSILLFGSIATAAPFSLLARQAVPDNEVCKLDPYSASSWSKSGADVTMKDWFNDHGESK
jgi:hypothetical protein